MTDSAGRAETYTDLRARILARCDELTDAALAAGVRRMCEIHVLKIEHPTPSYAPDACAECQGGLRGGWPCESLITTAQMLGLDEIAAAARKYRKDHLYEWDL